MHDDTICIFTSIKFKYINVNRSGHHRNILLSTLLRLHNTPYPSMDAGPSPSRVLGAGARRSVPIPMRMRRPRAMAVPNCEFARPRMHVHLPPCRAHAMAAAPAIHGRASAQPRQRLVADLQRARAIRPWFVAAR
jgi:hypothetical protein